MTMNSLQRLRYVRPKKELAYVLLSRSKHTHPSFSSSDSEITTTTNPKPNDNLSPKEQKLMRHFKKCSTMKDINQIHADIVKSGFECSLYLIGKIIVFCAVSERGDIGYGVSVFQRMENPDGFSWNTMIRGFIKANEPQMAFDYYKRMQEKGEVADNFTFSFLLKGCSQLDLAELGRQMHCSTIKLGLESHVFVRNTLIHMYGNMKLIGYARQLFDEMPSPQLVAWNTIIDCHVCCGNCKEALDLFSLMRGSCIEPDDATFVATLSACSALGALDYGRRINSCINRSRFHSVVQVKNSLIDMYVKCGAVEEAFEVFNQMCNKNTVTWNTMIHGLATHGHTNEALLLFSRMLEEKFVTPDVATFLGVLCACSHGGLVEEGKKYFHIMITDHGIKPTIKHYGSMVDILGRAGFVDEAYQLIRRMPTDSNAVVWRTLLAACRLHGNVEIGELASRHLLELVPDHSSDYVLLSNIYASEGQWNQVLSVRRSMHYRSVQKPQAGNSFIGLHPNAESEMDVTETSYETKN
ncbi:pentatricopeptide repeat-containing protein At2g02980, chloroplastic-like [Tripterygium wilfordii]|uniref:pentatricopeptide repeat-containing protein At2g02980, chloroplastic-like n=1 Tax=Tripterygium wilfordii TaxID=458696 RepID=UPI0018F820F5|nr:pentatricopeptide repeat-containing protein At2g02980, chloroplastic-like [Tripterygium wilfordii]XP_038687935.1 pentatricopeptide repeat-containing protein At2g02980, chloroplastic-like [Tripterygium wilfordii]XP_038687936.1 pentatricopeptide repeat-containing protein At2g02980, chloroplastic-like [Tripterygium wilfordii]